ncbi:unnamed protein product [Camellia sinensis]
MALINRAQINGPFRQRMRSCFCMEAKKRKEKKTSSSRVPLQGFRVGSTQTINRIRPFSSLPRLRRLEQVSLSSLLRKILQGEATFGSLKAEEVIDAADFVSGKNCYHPFPCDFSISGFLKRLAWDPCSEVILQKQDICLSGIFMLSALPLHRMPTAIAACFSVLKPGGLLLFRDYDQPKNGFKEYMRSDGARSYFFCLHSVRDLFVSAGFTERSWARPEREMSSEFRAYGAKLLASTVTRASIFS